MASAYYLTTNTQNFLLIFGILALILATSKKIEIGLIIILFLPVIGETFRLPIGGEMGTLISDIAIGVLAGIWILKKLAKKENFLKSDLRQSFLVFSLIAFCSLLQSLFYLTLPEVISSSLYLIRFIEYTLLIFIVQDVVKTEKSKKQIISFAIVSALLIAIAGFIQLLIYPNLGNLEELGWDPHMNRLVSTWLDPNFIAGFLTLIICMIIGIMLYTKKLSTKIFLICLIAIFSTALALTYSRSGYIAAAFGIIVLGLLKSRKVLLISIVIAISVIAFFPRAQQRVDELVTSAQSLLFSTSQNPDATARLRIKNWQETLNLIQKRPLLGSGYNTLRFVKYDEGFVQNTDVHSASGSDSSLLTIMATTGIVGLIPFIIFYWQMLKLSFQNWQDQNNKNSLFLKGYSLGLFAGILAILVHALFVNSLLFPQILIFLYIGVGILNPLKPSTTRHFQR